MLILGCDSVCRLIQGLLFSHGTEKLVAVSDSAADYLGGLDTSLTRYSNLFEDSTDLYQPSIGGTALVSTCFYHTYISGTCLCLLAHVYVSVHRQHRTALPLEVWGIILCMCTGCPIFTLECFTESSALALAVIFALFIFW